MGYYHVSKGLKGHGIVRVSPSTKRRLEAAGFRLVPASRMRRV